MDRGNTMFEDSLMESGNRITPKSKYWSFVALLLNGGALLALIIWPLLHPEALPTQMMATLMVAPSPPAPPPPLAPAPKVQIKSEMLSDELQAPSRIPKEIRPMNEAAIPPTMVGVKGMEGLGGGTPGGVGTIIDSIRTGPATVKAETPQKLTISSGVMFGNLLEKTVPQYPAIAKAARIQGTVVLQATISQNGVIQNLRVISGPPMLQQAAIDAVGSWRYKPYLLNGAPVEVETTINVVFNLGG
jgi:periplasmic protein TonB